MRHRRGAPRAHRIGGSVRSPYRPRNGVVSAISDTGYTDDTDEYPNAAVPGFAAGLRDRRFVGPVVEVGHRMAVEWKDDRVAGLAAEVAFWAVLSLFPALLALTAALGFIEPIAGADFAEDAQAEVVDWAERVLAGEGGEVTTQAEELFERRSAGLFTLGVLAALWTASRGFGALIRALDVVYDLDESRTWIGVRFTAVVLALGSVVVAVVVLALMLVGPLLGRGEDIAESLGLGDAFVTLWTYARVPVAVVILVAWATTVFHVAPNHRTPWRWDLPGALLTAVLWGLGIVGFRFYVSVSSSGANGVFGVLGGALTLMLWMYVTAAAVLLGGELNAELARRHGVAAAPGPKARLRRLGEAAKERIAFWDDDTDEIPADVADDEDDARRGLDED